MGNDRRRAYRINRRKDRSIVIEPESKSWLKRINPHVTAHQSSNFHVTYGTPKGRRRYRKHFVLAGGQPLSHFTGCLALCANVIPKYNFHSMKRFNSMVPPEFEVDLNRFTKDIVTVTVFLFDPASLGLFQTQAARLPHSIIKIIKSCQPNIGMVAHE